MTLKEVLTLGVPTHLPLMPPGVTEVLPAAGIGAAASRAAIETTRGSHRTFPDAQIIIPLKRIVVHRELVFGKQKAVFVPCGSWNKWPQT